MNAHQIVLSSISHWIPPGSDFHMTEHYSAWRHGGSGKYSVLVNTNREVRQFFGGDVLCRAVVDDFGNLVKVEQ